MGNEASQNHHKGSHLCSCGAGMKPRRGGEGGGKQGVCPPVLLVHGIKILCVHLWDISHSCPNVPSSWRGRGIVVVVIFNFSDKVMIFLHQCRKNRPVNRGRC